MEDEELRITLWLQAEETRRALDVNRGVQKRPEFGGKRTSLILDMLSLRCLWGI